MNPRRLLKFLVIDRRDLMVAFVTIVLFLTFIPIFTYLYFVQTLADKEGLMNHNDTGLVLLDRKGRPFFTFYKAKFKEDIPLDSIPKVTQQAVIAMEDKDFYEHDGYSPRAILRAFVDNLADRDLSYGASTLTQQLVKNSLLTSRKDLLRKYQEVVLAQEISRRYSKDEVLQMYLNSVYFGEGAFGIEQAAKIYFDKSAKQLTLAESALLAGLLPSPNRLSPLSNDVTQAKLHQGLVLGKMAEQGYINQEDLSKAQKEELKFTSQRDDINIAAPHFAIMVRDELIEKYGEEAITRSGFKVYTSLDLDWQKYAEETVSNQVKSLARNRVTNGSAVVMDPKTGEIRALVGSTNWYDDSWGKVNIALSPRPPGSSFKPIIYLRAIEKRLITPSTTLHDSPTKFANFDEEKYYASWPSRAMAQQALAQDSNAFYSPQNYDRRFRGNVTTRKALSNSLNVPAVEVMKKVGVEDGVNFAKHVGLTTLQEPSNYGLSLVLGVADVKLLELTNFYATLANQGQRNDPTAILEIKDKKDEVIYKYQPKNELIADKGDVFLISSILSDNKARSEVFGSALTVSRPAAVKTGTTEDYKDAWTLGYTPSLVVGVWVGNNFGDKMDNIAGSLGAAPIWRSLIEQFSKGTPVENFAQPDNIVKASGCFGAGKEATISGTIEYFVKGTESKVPCPKPSPSPTPAPKPAEQVITIEVIETQGEVKEEKKEEKNESKEN